MPSAPSDRVPLPEAASIPAVQGGMQRMGSHEQSWLGRGRGLVVSIIGLIYLGLLGCEPQPAQQAVPPPPPGVTVAAVAQQTVPIYLDYVGSTAAVRSVDIRARVEGFLQKRAFTEGFLPTARYARARLTRRFG